MSTSARITTCLVLAAAPACGYPSPQALGDGGTQPDASLCYGSYLKVCFSSPGDIPAAPLTLRDLVDTDGAMCNPHHDRASDYCIVAGAGVTVPTRETVRVFGGKPLILLSTTTVDLRGTLDISSSRGEPHPVGAGAASAALCAGATPADHASGGFGGSFGSQGGDGEPVDTIRATGGQAAPALSGFPTRLRGGCPGGAGSTDARDATPGAGGSGGGAVLVIAQAIEVTGQINASGAGGRGGPSAKAGGGGGGSGGMIVLDAPSITGTGSLFANGGGGGQGGAVVPSSGSGAGGDGMESSAPRMMALGGHAGNDGGAGGTGASALYPFGGSAPGGAKAMGGGGAGGGGAGFIHAPGLSEANLSPSSRDLP